MIRSSFCEAGRFADRLNDLGKRNLVEREINQSRTDAPFFYRKPEFRNPGFIAYGA